MNFFTSDYNSMENDFTITRGRQQETYAIMPVLSDSLPRL